MPSSDDPKNLKQPLRQGGETNDLEGLGMDELLDMYDRKMSNFAEGDIIRTIGRDHAHFAHYHTAGNPGRRDMDDTQELNYQPIFRAIEATGYDGYVGHEFVPKGDPVAALKAAFDLTAQAV